jgi:hypothetical protein
MFGRMLLFALLLQIAAVPADSYADSATAELVSRARGARARNERLVTAYTASVSQRMGVGIRALSRDRMLFREELAADIAWKRDGKSSITVTGARRALPVVRGKQVVPGDLDASVKWLVINPAEDYLAFLGDDDDGFIYPLREGGERDYRFAVGDTTTITLASGKKIRLLKLDVAPRRADWQLMSGSLWFDADTYGLVRAVFRPARAYEFRRDADDNDMEDVPSWVNPKAEIKFVTLEYGLYEDRWWMLRYVALDGVGNMGSWMNVPVKFERVYTEYEVEGGTPPGEGSTFRPAGTITRRRADGEPYRDADWQARRDSLRSARRACLDRSSGKEAVEACMAIGRRVDTSLVVVVPPDTASLLTSPTLGPPILEMGDLLTESELRGLGDAIRQMPGVPRESRLQVPRELSAILRHARYNRVEALSLGISGTLETGRFTVDALGRVGLADWVPNGELGLTRSGGSGRVRLGGYRRLATVNPEVRPFGVVNTVWGVIAQRDDGDYYRSLGVELTGENTETGWWSWRIFAERQKAAFVETSLSIPRAFDGDRAFRPNILADSTDQAGASVTLRGNEPLSQAVQIGGDVTFDGSAGDYEFGRAAATVRAILTPATLPAVALELSAGTSTGPVPVQSRFYLGGPSSLRGYTGAVIAGDSYWRGRIEVGNSFRAARLTAFSDIGWAGPRPDFFEGRPLIGTGVGASVLDGLVRLDLARGMRAPTGWRFDLYFDGRL